MKYLLACLLCWAAYNSPLRGEGVSFYLINATVSWAVVLGIYLLWWHRWAAAAVMVIESGAIVLNLLWAMVYLSPFSLPGSWYNFVVNQLTVLEVLVLAIGAPWDGLLRTLRECWGTTHHTFAAIQRNYFADTETDKE